MRALRGRTSALLVVCAWAGVAALPIVADGGPPQSLDGVAWTASSAGARLQDVPATVPGDLITDLERAGIIGNPWFETNFLDNSSVWSAPDWRYRTAFTPAAHVLAASAVTLVLESVKMGARVRVNGQLVGTATDQFVRYEFQVGSVLRTGVNELELDFDGAISTHGRFMACSGGWDWAPWSHTWTPAE